MLILLDSHKKDLLSTTNILMARKTQNCLHTASMRKSQLCISVLKTGFADCNQIWSKEIRLLWKSDNFS